MSSTRRPNPGKDQVLTSHLYDPHALPDFETDFIGEQELEAFAEALTAPSTRPVTALNDWRPIHQKIKKTKRRREPRRTKDETREGFVYNLLYFPLLFGVLAWIVFLFSAYNLTRLYIYLYEHLFAWMGRKETLRKQLQNANDYEEWKTTAKKLDVHLGNDQWKQSGPYSYYNHATVERVNQQLDVLIEQVRSTDTKSTSSIDDLKDLLEACIKNNFMG